MNTLTIQCSALLIEALHDPRLDHLGDTVAEKARFLIIEGLDRRHDRAAPHHWVVAPADKK